MGGCGGHGSLPGPEAGFRYAGDDKGMRTRCQSGLLARLKSAREGAVAVEFALVALPILTMIVAILEIGVMLVNSVTLHGALEEGARRLRTGEVYTAGDTSEQMAVFRSAVCDRLVLMSCDEVVFNIDNYSDYGAIDLSPPAMGDDGLPAAPTFDPGGAGQINVARVYVRYEFNTPFIGAIFSDAGFSSRLISYVAVVKGEPWD